MPAFGLPGVCSYSGLLTADGFTEKCPSDSSATAFSLPQPPSPLLSQPVPMRKECLWTPLSAMAL